MEDEEIFFKKEENLIKVKAFFKNNPNIKQILDRINNKKTEFIESSRMFCCLSSVICTSVLILVFYVFDVVKYQNYCNKDKDEEDENAQVIEYCDAPTLNFWVKLSLLSVMFAILVVSLYCTGPTIILFDPKKNIFSIDKKKLFCLPSVNYYYLDDLIEATIESDMSTFDAPNIQTFYFYCVTLKLKKESIGLGLGRDCLFLYKKVNLVESINRYLRLLSLSRYLNNVAAQVNGCNIEEPKEDLMNGSFCYEEIDSKKGDETTII